jgi:phenylacetate-CoA ligase
LYTLGILCGSNQKGKLKARLNKKWHNEFLENGGHKMDLIYDSRGYIISSFVIYTKFYKYYKLLKQHQFLQQGKKTVR